MKLAHDWIVPDWPAPAGVKSLITTRNGGVSTGAYASFNLGLAAATTNAQSVPTGCNCAATCRRNPNGCCKCMARRVVAADGMVEIPRLMPALRAPAGTVVVMIADCMPVLLCDRAASVVGIAHAGWRGLSSGVVENTVREMGVAPSELLAYLGPAIGPRAFEVGPDVRDAFIAADATAAQAFEPHREHKWLADLFRLAQQRLARCGITHIFGGGLCSYTDSARFYSYRRDKTSGRMAALIWLDP